MINHIGPVYSDYSITLAVIIFDLALITAIEHMLRPAGLLCLSPCAIGSGTAAPSPSQAGPKWIDLTWIHQFGSIGSRPEPLTRTAICRLTPGGRPGFELSVMELLKDANAALCLSLTFRAECVWCALQFNGAWLIFQCSRSRPKRTQEQRRHQTGKQNRRTV